MTDENLEKEGQILRELHDLRSEIEAVRAEWKSETKGNFLQYMVGLTRTIEARHEAYDLNPC